MRRIVGIIAVPLALGAVALGTVIVWRRDPRVGTAFMNSVVNTSLLRRGLAGGRRSEIGALEHIGRRTGIRRLAPVHPEVMPDGFRIIVPLGPHSEWARNVLAAGHCRLRLHDVVFDLDEPMIVPASDVDDLPAIVRAIMAALGFQYLELHTLRAIPGTLETAQANIVEPDGQGSPQAAVHDPSRDLVSSAR